jgi:hypothetical protein
LPSSNPENWPTVHPSAFEGSPNHILYMPCKAPNRVSAIGHKGLDPLFADPEASEPDGFTVAHTPVLGHSRLGNPNPEW